MNIYDTEEIENATLNQLRQIDEALVKTAKEIRDEARNTFINNGKYKGIGKLSDGIMIGKLENSSIKIHGFGNKSNYDSYKTRFYILGTTLRIQTKKAGKYLDKPFTKGKIEKNDAIDKAMLTAESKLNKNIKDIIQ